MQRSPADPSIAKDGETPYVTPPFIEFTVPYLCLDVPYDYNPQGFWDFPERAGWMLDGKALHRTFPTHIVWQDIHHLDAEYTCRSRAVSEEILARRPRDSLRLKCFRINGQASTLSEEVAFLQAWLFFGVLAEVSSTCGVSADLHAECIVVEDGSRMVSVGVLNSLICRWHASLNVLPDGVARERVTRLLRVVKHVMSLQTVISTYGDPKKSETRSLTYLQCKVLLSIRILFRAILFVLSLSRHRDLGDIHFLMDPQLEESFPSRWDELKEYSNEELLDNGWCKSECKLLEQMDGSCNFFATRFKRWRMDHRRCGDFTCLADQIDEDHYKTIHVESGCQCTSIIVNPEELRNILKKGEVPVVDITDEDELVVNRDRPYIAISHVWSHGLGNPQENSLPLCQIRRLRQNLSRLQVVGESRPAVWIDTLCIPVAKHFREYRKRAIELMGRTYDRAEVVLVLDRELQRVDARKIPTLQLDILKAFVGWTRRLWTLQEAALARKVYIETVSGLEPFWANPKDGSETLLPQMCFREGFKGLILDRIPPLTVLRQETKVDKLELGGGFSIVTTRTALQSLCFAVKHRSTSKMEDEAIILAITLGMDVKNLVALHDVDERIAQFFEMMRDVPCDIIFGDCERVRFAPYRWAPRSLLNFPIVKLDSFALPGICDSRGLHAIYQGFIFTDASARNPIDDKYFAIDRSSGLKYEFRCQDTSGIQQLPDKPALIFRPNNINEDVAVVNLHQHLAIDSEEPFVVNIVGYLKLEASGGLDFSTIGPDDILEGETTSRDRAWIIT
ncbi:hypothetical protein K435DRAFT_850919 [Dendrothele bispora CBS 962.96]|uniref:Heterokaryon incompatibility domain-containing protein n=1 Tax=Dendrothele bispora (strain CBS 962.96) TaxID=1314807 RepID=A0A4V4HHX7_DENBC|nr:hypothetical protein K435DRAFT_850919 [Dendrothele bispora CBS 962.96]